MFLGLRALRSHCAKDYNVLRVLISQVSPEKVDPRKVDTNFFVANFEYLRVLEVREDL